LNIDLLTMFGKLNMIVPVMDMCNIPSVRKDVLKLLKVQAEKEDPPIIFNTMYLNQKKNNNPPFYLCLGISGLCLKNCMLEFGASTNVMSLKMMEQISLRMTWPYGNFYGIGSKKVKVYKLCENIEFYLIDFPHISLIMNIAVIDVPDAWGIILSRRWSIYIGFPQYGSHSCAYSHGGWHFLDSI
jgi:hypothetical protein